MIQTVSGRRLRPRRDVTSVSRKDDVEVVGAASTAVSPHSCGQTDVGGDGWGKLNTRRSSTVRTSQLKRLSAVWVCMCRLNEDESFSFLSQTLQLTGLSSLVCKHVRTFIALELTNFLLQTSHVSVRSGCTLVLVTSAGTPIPLVVVCAELDNSDCCKIINIADKITTLLQIICVGWQVSHMASDAVTSHSCETAFHLRALLFLT